MTTKRKTTAAAGPIEHVFVLMLENRSFDHFFGWSGIHGASQPPAHFGFQRGAPDRLKKDPPHSFDDVQEQMADGTMTGFPKNGGDEVMRGFEPAGLPVTSALARNGLLMDNWYSSTPGPTWPNRFFAHAASSGGLDNNPGVRDMAQAVGSPLYAYRFDNGHLFERLVREGRTWRIYRSDNWPQSLALRGMVEKRLDRRFFRTFQREFKADLAGNYGVDYTFIEPDYDLLGFYRNGNSQHPCGLVSAGERLIKDTYDAIFSQAVGSKSVLLVTWDEHGGLFDHKPPPAATPPGDTPHNQDRASQPRNFAFDRFGPRVPAILLSPWLPTGLGSRLFPGKSFDHASVVSSVRDIFRLGEPLTQRDAKAPSWHPALLSAPRPMATLPRAPAAPKTVQPASTRTEPLSPNVMAAMEIALMIDWHLAAETQTPPLAASSFRAPLLAAGAAAKTEDGVPRAAAASRTILEYLAAVEERDKAHARKMRAAARR